jgi:NTE family protein
VLQRIGEIPSLRDLPSPFAVVAGASAGAINGSLLAGRGARLGEATREIARLWSQLRVEQVFRTDALALARTGISLARDFTLGALLGHSRTRALFDTAPLERLIEAIFPPRGIADAIRRGQLHSVAITATSYHSGRSFTFVQGRPGHPVWAKSRRLVLPVKLSHRHVLASAAIPVVFAPVRVASAAGELWFGDGGLRLVTPLSPAIRLGATHLLAVGVRSSRAAGNLAREEAGSSAPAGAAPSLPHPPLAQVLGVFLNAIFLDHLDADLDHLRRMNELVASGSHAAGASEPMRVVEPFVISPSEDLALVAQRFAHRMPRIVRHMLEGLGTPDAQSADLMSYLLFDAAYTRTLVDVGYRDAGERAAEIEQLIREAPRLGPAAVPPLRALSPARPARPRAGASARAPRAGPHRAGAVPTP